jgi:hypothetical protein
VIQIFAPHPVFEVLIYLPNPEWGDFRRSESTIQIHRSMNSAATITHVKRRQKSFTQEMEFVLTRLKSIEFMNFFEKYIASKIKMVDQDGNTRIGYLKINPLQYDLAQRAIVSQSVEEVSIKLELETTE